nr:hypothetical protein [Tanacetum cinerariifolium]
MSDLGCCGLEHHKGQLTLPDILFRCDPILGCYRLISRAKVIENQVLVEDQPYATADSPICYIVNPDPEEDLEDESKDGHTDYPTNKGADDDDDDSSGDDADDEDEEEASEEDKDEDEDEEEEHLASAESITAASLVVDPVPSAVETEPFETNESATTPPPAYRTITRMSIRAQTHIPFSSEVEVDRLLAIPTLPPSPLTPLSSPLPRIPSPPFPVPSPPTTSPTYTEVPLGYRAAGIRLRTASPPPLPLTSPLSLPPHIILPRTRTSAVMLPPQKRLCIALGHRYEIRERSSATAARSTGGFRADYGFVGTLDAEIRRDPNRELNLLRRDRRFHARTARLMKSEAKVAREAWVQAMDASDTACSETQMVALQSQQRPGRDLAHTDVSEEKMPPRKAPITRTTHATTTATTPMTNVAIRPMRPTRECTYTDYLKCQPIKFKGTEGVVGLTQWFERMETVFNISNCAVENQVKFATCTLHGVALTWWKSHVKTVGHDVTYGVPWNTLMKMITSKRMFPKESNKIEKYVGSLPDMIHGSVMASKPKTMQDAVEFETELMDKKIRSFVERQTENKRKFEDISRNNQNQQQQNKRQNTSRAHTTGAITPSDIQYFAATQIWGCYRLASRAKGVDEEPSDEGSPQVIVYGYDGLHMQPISPPSPDYIPGPEEPQTPPVPQDEDKREPMFIQLHDPDYPLPPVVSPTAKSEWYVAESDPEEDPEEYEDNETEDGPVDYPMDGGDDGDDDDGDSSGDDADDEDEDGEDEEEEE